MVLDENMPHFDQETFVLNGIDKIYHIAFLGLAGLSDKDLLIRIFQMTVKSDNNVLYLFITRDRRFVKSSKANKIIRNRNNIHIVVLSESKINSKLEFLGNKSIGQARRSCIKQVIRFLIPVWKQKFAA